MIPQDKKPTLDSLVKNIKTTPKTIGDAPITQRNLGIEELTAKDIGLKFGQDQQKKRYRNQSTWAVVGNNLMDLVPNVALGITEGVGYLGTLPDLLGITPEEERDYSNKLVRWASGNKDIISRSLGRETVQNPEGGLDLSSAKTWVNAGGDLVESIGSFLALGVGVGGALGKGAQLAGRLGKTAGIIGEGAATAGTVGALTFTESAMTGATIYKDVLETSGDKVLAAQAAATAVKTNMVINSALNITSLQPFVKNLKGLSTGLKRSVGQTDDSFLKQLRRTIDDVDNQASIKQVLALEGGQEYLEEINNAIAERRGQVEGGLIDPEDFLTSVLKVYGSKEGQFSGLLGVIGGVAQTGGTRILKGKQMAAQDEQTKKFANDLISDVEQIGKYQIELKSELMKEEPDYEKADEIKNNLFALQSYRSIENGSAYALGESFRQLSETDNTKDVGVEMQKEADSLLESGQIEEAQHQEMSKEADKYKGQTQAMIQGLTESQGDNSYKERLANAVQDIAYYQQLHEEVNGDKTLFKKRSDEYNTMRHIDALNKEEIKLDEQIDKLKNFYIGDEDAANQAVKDSRHYKHKKALKAKRKSLLKKLVDLDQEIQENVPEKEEKPTESGTAPLSVESRKKEPKKEAPKKDAKIQEPDEEKVERHKGAIVEDITKKEVAETEDGSHNWNAINQVRDSIITSDDPISTLNSAKDSMAEDSFERLVESLPPQLNALNQLFKDHGLSNIDSIKAAGTREDIDQRNKEYKKLEKLANDQANKTIDGKAFTSKYKEVLSPLVDKLIRDKRLQEEIPDNADDYQHENSEETPEDIDYNIDDIVDQMEKSLSSAPTGTTFKAAFLELPWQKDKNGNYDNTSLERLDNFNEKILSLGDKEEGIHIAVIDDGNIPIYNGSDPESSDDVIPFSQWAEKHPEGTAEWIKRVPMGVYKDGELLFYVQDYYTSNEDKDSLLDLRNYISERKRIDNAVILRSGDVKFITTPNKEMTKISELYGYDKQIAISKDGELIGENGEPIELSPNLRRSYEHTSGAAVIIDDGFPVPIRVDGHPEINASIRDAVIGHFIHKIAKKVDSYDKVYSELAKLRDSAGKPYFPDIDLIKNATNNSKKYFESKGESVESADTIYDYISKYAFVYTGSDIAKKARTLVKADNPELEGDKLKKAVNEKKNSMINELIEAKGAQRLVLVVDGSAIHFGNQDFQRFINTDASMDNIVPNVLALSAWVNVTDPEGPLGDNGLRLTVRKEMLGQTAETIDGNKLPYSQLIAEAASTNVAFFEKEDGSHHHTIRENIRFKLTTDTRVTVPEPVKPDEPITKENAQSLAEELGLDDLGISDANEFMIRSLTDEEVDQIKASAKALDPQSKKNRFLDIKLNPRTLYDVVDTIAYEWVNQSISWRRGKVFGFTRESDLPETYKNKLIHRRTKLQTAIDKKLLTDTQEKGAHRVIATINEVVDNYDFFVGLAQAKIQTLSGVKINEDTKSSGESEGDHIDFNNEKTDWSAHNVQTDGKMTTSSYTRLFLMGLNDYHPNGKPKRNELGQLKKIGFDKAFNDLRALLSDLPASLDDMVIKLQQSYQTHPWTRELVERLESNHTPMKAKVQFVKTFTSSKNNSIAGQAIEEGNKLNYLFIQTSTEARRDVVMDKWKNDIKANARLITSDNEINEEGLIELKQDLDSLKETFKDKFTQEAKKIYKKPSELSKEERDELARTIYDIHHKYGIDLHPKTIDHMIDQKTSSYTSYGADFFDPSKSSKSFGMISRIYTSLNNLKDDGTTNVNEGRILANRAIKDIATVQGNFESYTHSHSYMSGSKHVFAYVNRMSVDNRMNDLKEDSQFLRDLRQSHFHKNIRGVKDPSVMDMRTVELQALKNKGRKTFKDTKLSKLAENDHEHAKLALYFAANNSSSRETDTAQYFFPTMSNKSTMKTLTNHKDKVQVDVFAGNVQSFYLSGDVPSRALINAYNQTIAPELLRMKHAEKKGIKGYDDGIFFFFFSPWMMDIEDANGQKVWDQFFDDNDNFRQDLVDENGVIQDAALLDTVYRNLNNVLVNDANNKLQIWEDANIEFASNILDRASDLTSKEDKMAYLAAEYTYNYRMNNVDASAIFGGDPANFYKSKRVKKSDSFIGSLKQMGKDGDKRSAMVADTYENIGKRYAKLIAPGQQGYGWGDPDNEYDVLLADDMEVASVSLGVYKDLYGNHMGYDAMEDTDAQEFTTWQEHLYIKATMGDLTETEYHKLADMLNSKKPLDDMSTEELNLFESVFGQPIKPVQVSYINEGGVLREIYIKSSSYPLIPQFTDGMELDKLRLQLEDHEKNSGRFTRLSFSSGTKLGNSAKPPKAFNEEGRVNDDFLSQAEAITLKRRDMFIQQEVPYKDKHVINIVSQQRKLAWTNTHDKIIKGDKTGADYEKRDTELWSEWHNIGYKQLLEELGADNGQLDAEKLRKLLEKEAVSRGFQYNDIRALATDENGDFIIPLWGHISVRKYEALLAAIVSNRIIAKKFPGGQYVLGSEAGMRVITDANFDKSKIIFTSAWNNDRLQSVRKDNFTYQVFMPSYMEIINPETGKYEKIDLTQHVIKDPDTGQLRLDESVIDPKLLRINGFRIPNQGKMSMANIEIAGFLPKEMGNTMIATRDFVVKMGSDFDIDKLFTYHYNIMKVGNRYMPINKDNVWAEVRSFTGSEEVADMVIEGGNDLYNKLDPSYRDYVISLRERLIQNEINQGYEDLLSTDNVDIRREIAQPLDFGDLKYKGSDQAGKHGGWANYMEYLKSRSAKRAKVFDPMSDEWQKTKYVQGTQALDAVGVFASALVNHAQLQSASMQGYPVLRKTTKVSKNGAISPLPQVIIGGQEAHRELGKADTINGKQKISDVLAAVLSLAVDNEKERGMEKINMNQHTYRVAVAMAMFGYDIPHIVTFLNQPAIVQLVKEINTEDSILKTKNKRSKQQIMQDITSLSPADWKKVSYAQMNNIGFAELLDNVGGEIEPQQSAIVLRMFQYMDSLGSNISNLNSIISTDSKRLGKSMMSNFDKEERIMDLASSDENYVDDTMDKLVNPLNVLGEIKFVDPAHKASWEADGFVKLSNKTNIDGEVLMIKPRTVAGYATVNGLAGLNDTFSQKFEIYRDDDFLNIVADIEHLTVKELEPSPSQKVANKQRIFSNIMAYMRSNPTKLLSDKTALEERRRLMKKTGGDKATLAEFIRFIQRDLKGVNKDAYLKLKNTTLINMLFPDIFSDKSIHTVKANSSAKENIMEQHIHAEVIDMLVNPYEIKPANSNIKAPVDKEEAYTSANLIQDLVLYSFLNNANQSGVDFIRYIPIDYLLSIGFGDYIKATDMSRVNSKVDNLAPFVVQYFQNNPWLLNSVSTEDLIAPTDVNGKATTKAKDIQSFELDSEQTFEDRDLLQVEGNPFRKSLVDGRYYRIDKLGSSTTTEYDMTVDGELSSIHDLNKASDPTKGVTTYNLQIGETSRKYYDKAYVDKISSRQVMVYNPETMSKDARKYWNAQAGITSGKTGDAYAIDFNTTDLKNEFVKMIEFINKDSKDYLFPFSQHSGVGMHSGEQIVNSLKEAIKETKSHPHNLVLKESLLRSLYNTEDVGGQVLTDSTAITNGQDLSSLKQVTLNNTKVSVKPLNDAKPYHQIGNNIETANATRELKNVLGRVYRNNTISEPLKKVAAAYIKAINKHNIKLDRFVIQSYDSKTPFGDDTRVPEGEYNHRNNSLFVRGDVINSNREAEVLLHEITHMLHFQFIENYATEEQKNHMNLLYAQAREHYISNYPKGREAANKVLNRFALNMPPENLDKETFEGYRVANKMEFFAFLMSNEGFIEEMFQLEDTKNVTPVQQFFKELVDMFLSWINGKTNSVGYKAMLEFMNVLAVENGNDTYSPMKDEQPDDPNADDHKVNNPFATKEGLTEDEADDANVIGIDPFAANSGISDAYEIKTLQDFRESLPSDLKKKYLAARDRINKTCK